MSSRFTLHKNDLPSGIAFGDTLAVDTEFMGLNVWRDRLCLVQIYDGKPDSTVHIVQFERGKYAAPNLRKLLADLSKEKLCYYARADMRWIGHYLDTIMENVYCLKIASRIARTYTQSHDLEDVCKQLLGVKISKDQQCTDWGHAALSPAQLDYACNDVLYLHALKEKLNQHMDHENRRRIAYGLFQCLPHVVRADLAGWGDEDIFAHDPRKLS
ncbi:MAG: ribonuclease D [Proteobacteria bacterium]|nr:ribonuclease D [Pseudomonadota bacterium]